MEWAAVPKIGPVSGLKNEPGIRARNRTQETETRLLGFSFWGQNVGPFGGHENGPAKWTTKTDHSSSQRAPLQRSRVGGKPIPRACRWGHTQRNTRNHGRHTWGGAFGGILGTSPRDHGRHTGRLPKCWVETTTGNPQCPTRVQTVLDSEEWSQGPDTMNMHQEPAHACGIHGQRCQDGGNTTLMVKARIIDTAGAPKTGLPTPVANDHGANSNADAGTHARPPTL